MIKKGKKKVAHFTSGVKRLGEGSQDLGSMSRSGSKTLKTEKAKVGSRTNSSFS